MLDKKANLKGKVAALLGGGGGIGAACTIGLAENGVDVIVLDTDGDALEQTRAAVEAMGRRCVTFKGDVLSKKDVADFYDMAAREFDRLDIVVNVAGGVKQRDFLTSTEEEDEADIRRNFGYVIQSIRTAVKLIERHDRGGSIINFTTIEAYRGAAGFSVYAAAKSANANLGRALAVELATRNIRINEITPDNTPSNGNATALRAELIETFANAPAEALAKAMAVQIPRGQPATPSDLADTVVFLASDLSRSITGVHIHVDGGTAAAGGFLNWPGAGYCPAPLGEAFERMFLT